MYSRDLTSLHPELERLICAAVSNNRFAADLLAAPESALDRFVQARRLSAAEREMVISIHDATDIHEFAARLHKKVRQHRGRQDVSVMD